MLLTVDIGNSNIKMALFKREKVLRSLRLVTDKNSNLKHYKKRLKRLFTQKKVKNTDIEAIIICSVVPKLTPIIKKALVCLLDRKALVLGKDICAPIKNLYRKPKQVGQDRLANAVAAVEKYGAPTIIVDFGTALTFDLLSATGSYLGGIIVPGIEVSLNALIESADLLPKVSLARTRTLLGRETSSSMKSGIVHGYSFLVEGILQQLKKQLQVKPKVIATGGAAKLMFRYCSSIHRINENLTLDGLRISYQKGRRKINTQKQ